MKKILCSSILAMSICSASFADGNIVNNIKEGIESEYSNNLKDSKLMQMVSGLQQKWAIIKYKTDDEDDKLDKIHDLEDIAKSVTEMFPQSAEAKIWEAIILSTDAGIVKGISALGKVDRAKELLEEALKINPNALDGSAYTSLGSLYYQVPGWPISFGDNDKAEENLKKALQINPNGIDPNYFYGDFLLKDDRYKEAKVYLEKALKAPRRPDRPLADAGRILEINNALAEVNEELE